MFKVLAIAAAGITVSSMAYAADLINKKDSFTNETRRMVFSGNQEANRDGGVIRIEHLEGEEGTLVVVAGAVNPVTCDQDFVHYKVDNRDGVKIDADEVRLKFCKFNIPTRELIGAKTFAVRLPMFNAAPLVLSINISGKAVQAYFKEGYKKPE
jgi:hypothetical protein